MKLIEINIAKISELCHKFHVRRLFVFGSILTDRFNDDSDVDFIVDFDRSKIKDIFETFFDFQFSLEALLGRRVDLIEEDAISKPYFLNEVRATKKLIYG